jgi:MFS family permease
MRLGIAALVVAYSLSQFYRAFLAVLTPDLGRDLGATPEDLAYASGLWFLAFAAMQVPVGISLDRWGPRITSSALLLFAALGAAVFAAATAPWHVALAMTLIGVGCSALLMSSYVIFARGAPPQAFATLAAVSVGVGSLGNLAGSAPFAALAAAWGWRGAVAFLAALTLAVAVALWALVRDPPPAPPRPAGEAREGLLDLLRRPAFWGVLVMMAAAYGPAACLRGLWVGPYAEEVFGADVAGIGRMTLLMALAMIAGSFAYGPSDRLFGTRKWVVWGGNCGTLAALLLLAAAPDAGLGRATLLVALAGFCGAAFPMVMAHGRAFIPPHLTGRGVAVVNLCGIGGAGVLQFVTGPVQAAWAAEGGAVAGYRALFLLLAGVVAAGLLAYLATPDRTD